MNKNKNTLFILLILSIMIVLAFSTLNVLSVYYKSNNKLDSLIEQENKQRQEIENLECIMNSDETTLKENAIKNKLGFMYPNEEKYIAIS